MSRKEEYINESDPLFLYSKSLDEALSAEEQDRLGRAMRTTPGLREEAAKIQAVDRMMKDWRSPGVEIDWKNHEKLVAASMVEGDPSLDGVDELLEEWARRHPSFDDRRFADSVLARIAPNQRRLHSAKWLRLAAPLAAAAVVVLAVTGTWFARSTAPTAIVSFGPAKEESKLSGASPVFLVSFARTPSPQADLEASGIGYMTLGASPLPRAWEEAAPL